MLAPSRGWYLLAPRESPLSPLGRLDRRRFAAQDSKHGDQVDGRTHRPPFTEGFFPVSSNRTRRQTMQEGLESRLVMSTSLPADTIGVVSGSIPSPHAVADVSVAISPRNINGRHSIVLGESVSPAPGSGLAPTVVSARGSDGKPLPIQRSAPFVPGRHGSETVFITDGKPGPLTMSVAGRAGITGSFQVRTSLPGAINGTGQVALEDLRAFVRFFQTNVHDALDSPAADANQNGRIGAVDGKLLVRKLKPLTSKIPRKSTSPWPPGSGARSHLEELGRPDAQARCYHPGADDRWVHRLQRQRPGRLHLHRPGPAHRRARQFLDQSAQPRETEQLRLPRGGSLRPAEDPRLPDPLDRLHRGRLDAQVTGSAPRVSMILAVGRLAGVKPRQASLFFLGCRTINHCQKPWLLIAAQIRSSS